MAKGDHTAFTELFYHYSPKLHAFFLKKVKDKQLAEELLQDLFTRVWIHRSQFALAEAPENYLFRMGANIVIDHFRKLALELRIRDRHHGDEIADEQGLAHSVQYREVSNRLAEAVEELPAQRKKLYQLRDNGLSYQEIAEITGLSVNTIKNQLVAASKSIRDYLLRHGISPVLFIHILLLIKKINNG